MADITFASLTEVTAFDADPPLGSQTSPSGHDIEYPDRSMATHPTEAG